MRNSSPLNLRPGRSPFHLQTALGLIVLAIELCVTPPDARAATIWNGPKITFSKAAGSDPNLAANQDRITANVWITRGATQGIYNAKAETLYAHNFSPADTEWAYGTIANYASLTYKTWEEWYGGQLGGGPPATLGSNAVVHLKTEDIYIDIKFLEWGVGLAGQGAFKYERSTAGSPPNSPPIVSIDTPTNGAFYHRPGQHHHHSFGERSRMAVSRTSSSLMERVCWGARTTHPMLWWRIWLRGAMRSRPSPPIISDLAPLRRW